MKTFLVVILFILYPQFNFAQDSIKKSDDQIVYVTNTGSKYHLVGCSYLRNSGNAKKLSEVQNSHSSCSRGVTKSTSTSSSTRSPSYSTSKTTKTGKPIHTGPRAGKYHYSKSGKKVYERKKK